MMEDSEEKITFALEVLEDGLADAETLLEQKGCFTRDEWEEIRSYLEFAIKILKGEAVRGE